MRKWIGRFSFTFIALAVVFAWEGNKIRNGEEGPGHENKVYAYFAVAAVCFVMGLWATRERHRPPPTGDGDRK